MLGELIDNFARLAVSINSTSNNRSDYFGQLRNQRGVFKKFPLIPLPIIEAIWLVQILGEFGGKFPLIPLPIIEAIWTKERCRQRYVEGDDWFPLIPLPIIEAISHEAPHPFPINSLSFH